MVRKAYAPEQIINKLREAEIHIHCSKGILYLPNVYVNILQHHRLSALSFATSSSSGGLSTTTDWALLYNRTMGLPR